MVTIYSATSIYHLDKLLSGKNRSLFNQISRGYIADIGAADGDLSYFFETQGFKPHIIDFSPTNWNGLKGARALKKLLNSAVDIYEIDLDDQFKLPFEKYSLVLFLGILYHLKNPFYVLEKLSFATQYLILSTRTANLSKKDGLNLTDVPIAYLLGPEELNHDATNYWIFSDAGLVQLITRSGWKILDKEVFGSINGVTPQDLEPDQRTFMFLETTRTK